MKKLFFLVVSVGVVTVLPFMAAAEPYHSLNEICIVEKKGDGYWFLNEKELQSKVNQVFKTDRNRFEWFFTDNGKIVAKVYPAFRDAVLATSDDLYNQIVNPCKLTNINQKLAASVSYKYNSKDLVCACLKDSGRLKLGVKLPQLDTVPYEQWVLFFETGSSPSVITGRVPRELKRAWEDLPLDFMQDIVPCEYNASNEEIIKQFE